MKIKDKTGNVLFEDDSTIIKDTLEIAVKSHADLLGADLLGANLRGATLQGANLSYATLQSANLSGADLQGANLRGANLSGANLSGATLQGANLYGATLYGANLSYATLQSADLRGATLYGATLQGATLQGANLSGADLSGADLSGANLRDANLRDANLQSADLSGADLQGANLSGADLDKIVSQRTILPEGELIVWKKLDDNLIAKLSIPIAAKRVNPLGYRKCRFEFAKVIAIYKGDNEVKKGVSRHDNSFIYKVGEIVKPDNYDPNPLVECSSGIHAFITRQEALDY